MCRGPGNPFKINGPIEPIAAIGVLPSTQPSSSAPDLVVSAEQLGSISALKGWRGTISLRIVLVLINHGAPEG